MLPFLEKYNQLPQEIRSKVSAPAVMSAIDELEKKYGVDLAATVIRIMTKEINIHNLASIIQRELNLDKNKSQELEEELKSRVFGGVADYLGLTEIQGREDIPPASRGKALASGANFFFSPEDEEEVRELAKKINGYSDPPVSAKDIEKRLNNIVSQAQINFGSTILAERFREILKTYIRGIRDRIEIKQALIKSFEAGGLGFDSESVEKILKIVDGDLDKSGEKIEIKPPPKIKIPGLEEADLEGLKKAGARDFEYDLASLVKKEKDKIDTSHEIAPPPPSVATPSSPLKPILQEKKPVQKIKPKEKSAAKPVSKKTAGIDLEELKAEARPVVRRPAEAESKTRIEDVRAVPRVMSPVDELKYMDLINFRRLSKDPEEITSKIIEKLNLLEEESYAKRLEGIKFWRISPVNRLYLEMGQASISENKPIDVIIEERKMAGDKYLSIREFDAVMDLNKNLRF